VGNSSKRGWRIFLKIPDVPVLVNLCKRWSPRLLRRRSLSERTDILATTLTILLSYIQPTSQRLMGIRIWLFPVFRLSFLEFYDFGKSSGGGWTRTTDFTIISRLPYFRTMPVARGKGWITATWSSALSDRGTSFRTFLAYSFWIRWLWSHSAFFYLVHPSSRR
jgi:hypothetical protein